MTKSIIISLKDDDPRFHDMSVYLRGLFADDKNGIKVTIDNGERNQSNLVDHAVRELTLIGEDPEFIEGYVNVIQAFADMHHSGGSASVAIPVIKSLLEFKNLKPLTNDPDEWNHIDEGIAGVEDCWQSKRNPEVFSNDGGKTFYRISEGLNPDGKRNIYESEEKLN